jgi:hypothetical protein
LRAPSGIAGARPRRPPRASRVAAAARQMLSAKAERFTESVIREMTRLAMQHDAVNMAQGFPDFPASAEVKEAARQAISDDINQYAITWGAKELRDAIARKFERTQGVRVDPEREITVTCGSTEAMMATMMGIINPGDEVVIFEPHYENYGPDAILSGATPRFVQLRRRIGASIATNSRARSGPKPRPSSSTRRTIPRARFSPARNWNSSATSACAGTRSPSPTKFTSTLFTTARSTSRWPRWTACATAPSPSTACRKPTASPDGASAGPSRRPMLPSHSQSARFSDRRRRGATATGRRGRPGIAAQLLPKSSPKLSREARPHAGILDDAGFRCFKPAGAYYIMTDISDFNFPTIFPSRNIWWKKSASPSCPAPVSTTIRAMGARQVRFTFCKKESTLAALRGKE